MLLLKMFPQGKEMKQRVDFDVGKFCSQNIVSCFCQFIMFLVALPRYIKKVEILMVQLL